MSDERKSLWNDLSAIASDLHYFVHICTQQCTLCSLAGYLIYSVR